MAAEPGPWRVLRDSPDIDFSLDDLPGGLRALYGREGDVAVIVIDRSLSQADRLAALAHELTHHRHGGSGHAVDMPKDLCAGVEREERRVDLEAALWLVPLDDLRAFACALADMGDSVEAWHVAEEFGVPDAYASLALEALRRCA